MGNLKQEHNFITDGDGLAQWLGNRLDQLKQRGNWSDLTVQLDFMLYELNTSESEANTQLKAQSTIDGSVVAFQDKFERCNPVWCMQDQRISYAYEIYNNNKE